MHAQRWISNDLNTHNYVCIYFFDGLVPYGGSMIRPIARSRELSAVNQTVYVNVSRSFMAKLRS